MRGFINNIVPIQIRGMALFLKFKNGDHNSKLKFENFSHNYPEWTVDEHEATPTKGSPRGGPVEAWPFPNDSSPSGGRLLGRRVRPRLPLRRPGEPPRTVVGTTASGQTKVRDGRHCQVLQAVFPRQGELHFFVIFFCVLRSS
jgi:hypothetical protein